MSAQPAVKSTSVSTCVEPFNSTWTASCLLHLAKTIQKGVWWRGSWGEVVPVRRGMQERDSVGGLRRAIQRKDHYQSDKRWNRFKDNIGETSERQAGVHIYVGYFPSTWISSWTELCVEKKNLCFAFIDNCVLVNTSVFCLDR